MRLLFITDQHFGVRNDAPAFYDFQQRFYEEELFPFLDANPDIRHVVDLGDTFDRRKYVNFHTLQRAKGMWFDPLRARGIEWWGIVGNHTAYFKNTNQVNTLELLFKDYENMHIFSEAATVDFGGVDIAMLPWICSGNYEQSMEFLKTTPADILLGHLELKGFEMYRGSVNDHGFETDPFKRFDVVCSGHFHHKSSRENIHYLGAPYEMTWSDYNDARGFHVFDTETRELTFHQNPFRAFFKYHYDDTATTLEGLLNRDFEGYRGTFVKVIVRNKNNPFWFDTVIDKLERVGALDVQVVDDHYHSDASSDEDIIDEAEDALTSLIKYGEQLNFGSKSQLDALLRDLYHDAMSLGG